MATAKDIMARAERAGCEIVLPTDVVVAKELKQGVEWRVCPVGDVPPGAMILDFGPEASPTSSGASARPHRAVERPSRRLRDGAVRRGDFCARPRGGPPDQGGKLVSVAGGGDTVRALNDAHVAGDFTYVSTAGGAFLEWLGGDAVAGCGGACPQRRPRRLRIICSSKFQLTGMCLRVVRFNRA